MEHLLGREWEIYPAGGATGEAFIARNEKQKLFLKRNSSPFLAVLSAEGIVPKLIWTKRLENGDVITAQHCVDGRELSHQEMNNEKVAMLLSKIHRSKPLLTMLKRLGKSPFRPENILTGIIAETETSLEQPVIGQAIVFLRKHVTEIDCEEMVVCHCDVNHNNWLLSHEDELYLIDWDGAMIADPAIDLGVLLYSYVLKDDWESWLGLYGVTLDDQLRLRLKWYVVVQLLWSIQWHKEKKRYTEMNDLLSDLKTVMG